VVAPKGKPNSHDNRGDCTDGVTGQRAKEAGKPDPDKWSHDLYETLEQNGKPRSKRGGPRGDMAHDGSGRSGGGAAGREGRPKTVERVESVRGRDRGGAKAKDKSTNGTNKPHEGPPAIPIAPAARSGGGARRHGVLATATSAAETRAALSGKGQPANPRKGGPAARDHVGDREGAPGDAAEGGEATGPREETKGRGDRFKNEHDDRGGSGGYKGKHPAGGGGGADKDKVKSGADGDEKWQHNMFDPRGPRSGDVRKQRGGPAGGGRGLSAAEEEAERRRNLKASIPTSGQPSTGPEKPHRVAPPPTRPVDRRHDLGSRGGLGPGLGSGASASGGAGMVPIPSTASYLQRRQANPLEARHYDQAEDIPVPVQVPVSDAPSLDADRSSYAAGGERGEQDHSFGGYPTPAEPTYDVEADSAQQCPPPPQQQSHSLAQGLAGSTQQAPFHRVGLPMHHQEFHHHHHHHHHQQQQYAQQQYQYQQPSRGQNRAPQRGGFYGEEDLGGASSWGHGSQQHFGGHQGVAPSTAPVYHQYSAPDNFAVHQQVQQQPNLSASAQSYQPGYADNQIQNQPAYVPSATYLVPQGTVSQYQRFNEQQQIYNSRQ
jgi:hypothetical protein